MNVTFFDSAAVKIFPCCRRNSTWDPEAHFTSEQNLTHLYGLAFGHDSYIIETIELDSEKLLWRLVIKGYYFEITTSKKFDGKYFVIGLRKTNGIPSTILGSLAVDNNKISVSENLSSLDIENEGIFKCRAICAVDAIETDLQEGLYYVGTQDTLSALAEKAAKPYTDAAVLVESETRLEADTALSQRLDIIEGSDTDDGSIAKALKDAKAYTDECEAEIKKYADQAEVDAKKDATDNLAAAVEALEAADSALSSRIEVIVGTEGVEGTIATGDKATLEAAKTYAKDYADGLAGSYDAAGSAADAEAKAKNYANDELAKIVEAQEAIDAAQDEEIGKKLDTATYEAYIAGKELSDEVLKSYADGKASEAQTAAISAAKTETENQINTLVTSGQVNTNTKTIAKNAANITAMDEAYRAADSAIKSRLDIVEGKLTNVSNVMDFIGEREVAISIVTNEDETTTEVITVTALEGETFNNGDVVVDKSGKEYVYDDKAKVWHEFGYADGNTAAIAQNTKSIGDLEKSIGDLEAYVGDLPDDVAATTTVVDYLEDYIEKKTENVLTSEELTSLTGRVKVLEDSVGNINTNIIATLEARLEPFVEADTSILTALGDVKTRLNTLETSGFITPDGLNSTLSNYVKADEIGQHIKESEIASELANQDDFVKSVATALKGNTIGVFAVAFDANGGEGSMPPRVIIGSEYILPTIEEVSDTFIRPDYILKGWNVSSEATTTIESCELHGNTVFYAVWESTENSDPTPEPTPDPEPPTDPEPPIDPEPNKPEGDGNGEPNEPGNTGSGESTDSTPPDEPDPDPTPETTEPATNSSDGV